MRTESRRSILAAAAALPPIAATLAVLVFSVLDVSGKTPYSWGRPRNIAEAAGMNSGADVLRLLRAGEDPNRILPVRRELISSIVTRVNALEAAVWSRHIALLQILDREGAIVDDATRRHLACLARDLRTQDIVEYLSPENDSGCVPGEAMEAVFARSRESSGEREE